MPIVSGRIQKNVESQEEFIVLRSLFKWQHCAKIGQWLTEFNKLGRAQRIDQCGVGLTNRRFQAVHAHAHSLDRYAFRRRAIKSDEVRFVEQISEAVELRGFEQYERRFSCRLYGLGDIKQQEEFLANASVVVLLNLRLCQRASMHRGESNRARERSRTADFAAENQCERVLPINERAARNWIGIRDHGAIDIDPTAVDRAIRCNNVLQRRLQNLVHCGRRQGRFTVQVCQRLAAAVDCVRSQKKVVVVQVLLQREVAILVVSGIADDACHFLRYIGRNHPSLD